MGHTLDSETKNNKYVGWVNIGQPGDNIVDNITKLVVNN